MRQTTSVPHVRTDPFVAERDPENPEGLVLNLGEVIEIGIVDEVADECGVPFHELLIRYEEFGADKFVESDMCAEGLFIFPKAYIIFTTYFDEIMPIHVADGADELPYTVATAFIRPASKEIEQIVADIMAGKP